MPAMRADRRTRGPNTGRGTSWGAPCKSSSRRCGVAADRPATQTPGSLAPGLGGWPGRALCAARPAAWRGGVSGEPRPRAAGAFIRPTGRAATNPHTDRGESCPPKTNARMSTCRSTRAGRPARRAATLFSSAAAIDIVAEQGLRPVLDAFHGLQATTPWSIHEVRRIYHPRRGDPTAPVQRGSARRGWHGHPPNDVPSRSCSVTSARRSTGTAQTEPRGGQRRTAMIVQEYHRCGASWRLGARAGL